MSGKSCTSITQIQILAHSNQWLHYVVFSMIATRFCFALSLCRIAFVQPKSDWLRVTAIVTCFLPIMPPTTTTLLLYQYFHYTSSSRSTPTLPCSPHFHSFTRSSIHGLRILCFVLPFATPLLIPQTDSFDSIAEIDVHMLLLRCHLHTFIENTYIRSTYVEQRKTCGSHVSEFVGFSFSSSFLARIYPCPFCRINTYINAIFNISTL